MKKLISAIILGASLLNAPVNAETLKGGYAACTSEDLFDQFVTALVKKDKPAITYLLSNGCIITKEGIQISVLDRSWGKAKVRAYFGNNAIVLWTNSENIKR